MAKNWSQPIHQEGEVNLSIKRREVNLSIKICELSLDNPSMEVCQVKFKSMLERVSLIFDVWTVRWSEVNLSIKAPGPSIHHCVGVTFEAILLLLYSGQ